MFSKYLSSRKNVLNIQPKRVDSANLYYVGVFEWIKNAGTKTEELIEKVISPSGSGTETIIPIIVDCMNRRGNWRCITTDDAKKIHHIDFTWTNATLIGMKATVQQRLLLDSVHHYLSNKSALYETFKGEDWIPKSIKFNKDNILNKQSLLDQAFHEQSIIVKPDLGFYGSDIMVKNRYNFEEILDHIQQSGYADWSISEVIKSKLINDRVMTHRVYLLVTKKDDRFVEGYYYTKFINIYADAPYTDDITDKRQFVTNYWDRETQTDMDFFRRYIPHDQWLTHFLDEEQESIYDQLVQALRKICERIKDDILSMNDNKLRGRNQNSLMPNTVFSYHLYGLDVMIDRLNRVKVLEVNGAPLITSRFRFEGIEDRFDHFTMVEELMQKTVDTIYEPLNKQQPLHDFVKIYQGERASSQLPLFYIPNSIVMEYPFVLAALRRRGFLKRTKNLHDEIDVFYGLRERYMTDGTSMNYYDEILNYATSKRMRKAAIINKIQGVTYYLANKAHIYQKLVSRFGPDHVHEYHPISKTIFVTEREQMFNQIKSILDGNLGVKRWIVKPVDGSRGIGIKIFKPYHVDVHLFGFVNCMLNDFCIEKIVDHIEEVNQAFNADNNIQEDDLENLEGIDEFKREVPTKTGYKYWQLSQYIDDPHLINERKYNLRFYVLLNIRQKLPTYANLSDDLNPKEYLEIYMSTDFIVYFAMLPYHAEVLPEEYAELDEEYFIKMKHITNLEMINKVYEKLGRLDRKTAKRELTNIYSHLVDPHSEEFINVQKQAKLIVQNTIDCCKYDFRSLNRHNDNCKGCFNLLAYDTLLDINNKLWLIEINRGPDLKGLVLNIGNNGCESMFDDIFKIAVDPHYSTDYTVANSYSDLTYFEKIDVDYECLGKQMEFSLQSS